MGVASRLDTDTGPVFLKAAPLRSPAIGHYQREAAVNAALPAGIPAPRLLWSGEVAGWLLLSFGHLDGRDADLAPGSPDLTPVLRTVGELADRLTPNPWDRAPSVAERFTALREKADELLAQCPGEFPVLEAAAAGFSLAAVDGGTLLHADLHAGNFFVTADGVSVIDWSLASRGAPWVDVAMLVPRLVAAGHGVAGAESLAGTVPGWKAAPEGAVTGLAAVRALFAEHQARSGPPRLRAARAIAAVVGRAWVEYRIGAL
ncbi:aminoglycoside phosphotransferase family protein [Pseudofrankia asymbiotica]|uniref:Aminoglycoside phosphotransferase domain-containing protein n=1 Tax=Pseudofrankia asymbiotica TaxID=1834516 RepID=A0A1V2ICS7_9ACTN|nr:aminoglycoside phosphotransferase family protein [Pseudofrankia asymbiotica]ONH30820.1 hypothetical protein BL253_11950 [Pseudofrankia asymbiotica]